MALLRKVLRERSYLECVDVVVPVQRVGEPSHGNVKIVSFDFREERTVQITGTRRQPRSVPEAPRWPDALSRLAPPELLCGAIRGECQLVFIEPPCQRGGTEGGREDQCDEQQDERHGRGLTGTEELEADLVNQQWQHGSPYRARHWSSRKARRRMLGSAATVVAVTKSRRGARSGSVMLHAPPARCAVDCGGFAVLGRNALQTSQKNEGGVAEPPPDTHNGDAMGAYSAEASQGNEPTPMRPRKLFTGPLGGTATPRRWRKPPPGSGRDKVDNLEEPAEA